MQQLSLPLKVGLTCGAIGILLTVVGILRGNVPLHPASIGMALLIGGGFWFLVSWAVATSCGRCGNDVAAAEAAESVESTHGN
ncbi:MAG: hypothetical protein R2911_23965 [Caldilineaceae bacterium]